MPDCEQLITMQEVIKKVRGSNDVTAAIYINIFARQAIAIRDAEIKAHNAKILGVARERGADI